jgi:hypothetical protein
MMVYDISKKENSPIEKCVGLILKVNKSNVEVVYASSSNDLLNLIPNSLFKYYREATGTFALPRLSLSCIQKLNLNVDTRYYVHSQEIIDKLGFYYNGREILLNKIKRNNHHDWIPNYLKPLYFPPHKQYLIGNASPSNITFEKSKYSFGIELETSGSSARITDFLLNNSTVQSLRDGSVGGHEFVTNPLVGDAGLRHLEKIVGVINRTSVIDKTCGVHVHIGGANFNKDFLVLSFILGLKMEDEFLSIVPNSRKNNPYCDSFRNFDWDAEQVLGFIKQYGYDMGIALGYEFLIRKMVYNDNFNMSDYNSLQTHPFGRYCGKYNEIENHRNFRYKWLNLIPVAFNMKNAKSPQQVQERATIEFRHHSATLNYDKIKNFIMLCSAFVRYVENNQLDIINKDVITINDILKEAYPKKAKKLISYFETRKSLFNTKDIAIENNEYTTNVDFKTKKVKNQFVVLYPEIQNAVVNNNQNFIANIQQVNEILERRMDWLNEEGIDEDEIDF